MKAVLDDRETKELDSSDNCRAGMPTNLAGDKPIFIIDDDPESTTCTSIAVRRALRQLCGDTAEASSPIRTFADALAAVTALNDELPALIFLDVLLAGPNGFTLLNELASYTETAEIPIIIMSSLDLTNFDLAHYGVVRILQKSTMTPQDVVQAVLEFYQAKTTAKGRASAEQNHGELASRNNEVQNA